jgi:hypothetical protein
MTGDKRCVGPVTERSGVTREELDGQNVSFAITAADTTELALGYGLVVQSNRSTLLHYYSPTRL